MFLTIMGAVLAAWVVTRLIGLGAELILERMEKR